ncbi:hypothetical protein VPT02_008 [Vibrio phage VPT02]|nr:hypothetical protein VPT02_008 [Vibrio phage VPT02]
MKITRQTIASPKEVLRFLALYAGKTLPNDPWTLAVSHVYLKPLKNMLVLDYAGIEATFGIDKDWICKNYEKRSWLPPVVKEKPIDPAVEHFLENDLTAEHVIERKQGFQFNYTKIALDCIQSLNKIATRANIRDAKKPRATDLALGQGSQRTQYIRELFLELDFEAQQELLLELQQASQAPAEIPDTLE